MIAKGFIGFFSRTPLRFNQGLGKLLGHLVWKLAKRERCIALRNLELCFPEKTEDWRNQKARESLQAMMMALLESPRIWSSTSDELEKYLDNRHVLDEILEVYAQGRGLVIATPHLGSWEYVGQLLAQHVTMTNLFRPPRMHGLTETIIKGRGASGANIVPTNSRGIRALSQALNRGECTGILPDQEPEKGHGIFAEFFSRPAYTMMLLPRFVKKRRTPVIFLFAERRSSGRFRFIHQWANEEIYDDDPAVACQMMNQQLEYLIRCCPSQYNWAYKRFKTQPTGQNPYR